MKGNGSEIDQEIKRVCVKDSKIMEELEVSKRDIEKDRNERNNV